ncbi:MAG: DUF4179 domain-containing protein [Eubacteriales bacterium]|nr:DUF4179 domain-containing protein [Eubacteriales bacterium]
MFKERYQHMSRQITPDDALVQKVLETAHVQEKRKFRTIRRYTRPAAAILAACMGVTIAMPALADNVEPVYQAIYQISPSAAQFFMPVHMSDEENGIRMEVESAYVHGNTVEAYITMRDLTGDRIDETIDLNDSYDINLPFDCMSATCNLVDYNKETKTARFYILIQGWEANGQDDQNFSVWYSGDMEDGSAGEQPTLVTSLSAKDIVGDKITFTLNHFLSQKKEYNNIQIPIDLSSVTDAAQTQKVELNGWGSRKDTADEPTRSSLEDTTDEPMPKTMTALVPETPRHEFSVDGVDLTGIAYIDGKLHVQIASNTDEKIFDGEGYLTLVKQDGTVVESIHDGMFNDGNIRYDEAIFDVPKDEISDYTLTGTFVTCGINTEGNWRVTFPLENGEK